MMFGFARVNQTGKVFFDFDDAKYLDELIKSLPSYKIENPSLKILLTFGGE